MAPAERSKGPGLRRHVAQLAIDWAMDCPERRWQLIEGTLCFADISGFTALAERLAQRGRLGGEELVDSLGTVFATMMELAHERGGMLLKFGGDALLLFFQGADHAQQAACAAVEMRQALRSAGKTPTAVGPLKLSMSVGVHSGDVLFFLVGSSHRELVLLGAAANTVIETENAADAGEIVVSADTANALPGTAVKPGSDGKLLLRWRRAPQPPAGARPYRAVNPQIIDGLFPPVLADYLAGGAPEPEHRVACIAFIRYSGTDRLLAELGPDALADALQETIGTVQRCLVAEGVTLLAVDVDRDGGKLFVASGVPYAHEDDEGVMLRALRRIGNTPLPLQIGVNRGHVFAAEIGATGRAAFSAMGDTTNTAARITGKTPRGEIFAHPAVLDESLTLYEVTPATPLILKGKTSPQEVYAIGAEIGARQREGLEVQGFIGRMDELTSIRQAIGSLASGTGAVLHIVADAGLGKSRLLRESVADLDHSAVLALRAEPYGTNSPYRLFRDPLRTLLGVERADPASMRDALERELAARAPMLVPLLPLLAEVLHIDVPPTAETEAIEARFRPDRIAEAVIGLLDALCAGALVIMVDDAHWSDEASTQLLERLAAATGKRSWLMLVARRDTHGGFEPASADQIHLGPMNDDAIRSLLLTATEAAPLRPHELETLVQRAGGNPLFATEVIKAARAVGSLDAVPESLEAAMAAQVDALDPAARRVLRFASVLGRSFSRPVLTEVMQLEGLVPNSATWERLHGFLEADGDERLRFSNGMVRDTTYEGMAYRQRNRLHLVAGETLERRSDNLESAADALALHFWRGDDFSRSWHYARQAADRSAAVFANADAARLYEIALDAARRLPQLAPADHIELWSRLGHVRELAGLFDGAMQAYRRALQLTGDDPVPRAALLIRRARAKERTGAFVPALRDLGIARKGLEASQSPEAPRLRAQLKSAMAMVRWGQDQPRRALMYAQEAEQEARLAGERASLGQALNVLEMAHLMLEGPGSGDHLREALSIFEALGDISRQAHVRANLGVICAIAGRWDEGVEWLSSAGDCFRRTGDDVGAANSALNLGEMLVKQRKYVQAEPVLRESIRVMRAAGFSDGVDVGEMQLAQVLMARGMSAEAAAMLKRVQADFTQAGQPLRALEACVARCMVQRLSDNPALGLELLEQATSAAGADADLLLPTAALERGLAMAALGRFHEAQQQLALGRAAAQAHHLPYEEAMLMLAEAEVARSAGRPEDSAEVDNAEAILRGLGVSP